MKHKSIKKGGSGLYLNANDKEAFTHFLQNSTSKFLTSGTFGMTYVLTLNPGVESKYLSLDASNYSQPVKQLLLKTTFIYPLKLEFNVQTSKYPIETKTTTTIDGFYEEVNIQTDVYLKTMKYLEPLCPAIVYATVVNDMKDPLMTKASSIISKNLPPDTKRLISSFPGLGIGLIGMELVGNTVGNATILYEYMHNTRYYNSYIAKAYYTLIEFIIQTGYSHGDFHGSNLLVDENITDYFWGKRGKVTIIDFGFAEKLKQEKYNQIKSLYDQQKYVDILRLLCDIPRKDGYDMNDFTGYTNMCLKTQPTFDDNTSYIVDKTDINNKIIQLYGLREEAINNLVKTFTAKKLPLSNTDKNNMYNGPILEKKYITTFEHLDPLRNMPGQVDSILRELASLGFTYNNVKSYRMQSKACYMLMYLLNNGFVDSLDIRFAIMVYAGVFDEFDDITYVFRITVRYVSNDALKRAIEFCMVLQSVYFNDFLDYFTDEQLSKVTQNQLNTEFNEDFWLFRPELAAITLKLKANIKTNLHKPVRNINNKQMFEELPFGEPTEIDIVEENVISTVVPPSDNLPRPSFFDKGLQAKRKPKMTAGKNKRKISKTKKRNK